MCKLRWNHIGKEGDGPLVFWADSSNHQNCFNACRTIRADCGEPARRWDRQKPMMRSAFIYCLQTKASPFASDIVLIQEHNFHIFNNRQRVRAIDGKRSIDLTLLVSTTVFYSRHNSMMIFEYWFFNTARRWRQNKVSCSRNWKTTKSLRETFFLNEFCSFWHLRSCLASAWLLWCCKHVAF